MTRIALALACLVALAMPAEARHHHARCLLGSIRILHSGQCVSKHSRAARKVYHPWAWHPGRARGSLQEAGPTPPPRKVAKTQDRRPERPESQGLDIPYWEPYPIMGRGPGRWWWLSK